MSPTKPSQSAEDYLERIHELITEKGYARVIDIAKSLEVRQASVTSMVQRLAEMGYLHYEKYRGLFLTDLGREVAETVQRRHATLSRFFSLFQLPADTQRRVIPAYCTQVAVKRDGRWQFVSYILTQKKHLMEGKK